MTTPDLLRLDDWTPADPTVGPYDEKARRRDHAIVFGSAEGRRVLADLAAVCFARASTYVRGDAIESARREGARAVWLRLAALLDERRAPPPPESADS